MMPGIRGKLVKGKTGTIELEEDKIVIKEEKGFFSKRLEEVMEIPLSRTNSTSIEEKQPPFRSMMRIRIGYQEGEEILETLFFSEDTEGLETIKVEIDADIERRRVAAEKEEAARRRERESNVHHISLVLEMIDQIFQILVSLHGETRWDSMSRNVAEVERIVTEMESLRVVAPVNIYARGLASAVEGRKVEEIKEEVYAIISVAHRDAERLAQYEGTTSFELELHEVFVKSYLLLWDMYLGESIRAPVDEDEVKELKETFSKLSQFTGSKACLVALQEIDRIRAPEGIAPHIEGIKLLMLQCLESLVE
jgi:hypothetical protein